MKVEFKRNHPNAQIPEYKTSGSVAFDIGLLEDVEIAPRTFIKVRTGLVINIPDDHALILASRSSNPGKKGIDMANSIGIIDSDYCGPDDEIHLLLENITDQTVKLLQGDRVAQAMLVPISRAEFVEVQEMKAKNRGNFGSTGR